MAEGGIEASDYLKFISAESSNVANDGMFSIQVMHPCIALTPD